MGLFDKKTTVPPGVAECESHIAELEKQRKNVIFSIGSKYVEENSLEDAEGTPYEEDMRELETIVQNMAIMEKRKLALQGLRKCEKCDNVLAIDSAFCNKCGDKLEALQAEVMKNICPQCGASYEDGAGFCISCGAKLG